MSTDTLIYIVDDDKVFAEATASVTQSIGYQPKIYHSPLDFLELYTPRPPETLVLDVRMPKMSGLELQQLLISKYQPTIPMIFVTGHGDIEMAVSTIKAGAIDFLTKPLNQQKLIDAVNRGVRRSIEDKKIIQQTTSIKNCIEKLTTRELQILKCMMSNMSSKNIAEKLFISSNTVDTHRANIFKKFSVSSINELHQLHTLHELL